jgi:protein PhnA
MVKLDRALLLFANLQKNFPMPESTKCPKCSSLYGYPTGTSMMCPECGHEWNPEETAVTAEAETDSSVVKDANGNVLQEGDTVVLIKDLPVKGAPKPIKAGTKVKNIKLTSGDHNIDCKIEGFGAMALKSIFVKKG